MAPSPAILERRVSLPPGANAAAAGKAGFQPGQYSISPTKINNQGYFALFAILGTAIVLASIWFFFWARNGGFHFRKTDWDDYKSTVLRRKGPDGKTLSAATKSTKLGGGSIVGHDDGLSSWGGSSTMSDIYNEKLAAQGHSKHKQKVTKNTGPPQRWKRGAIRKQQQQQHHHHQQQNTRGVAAAAAALKHKQQQKKRSAQDADVRAYRHEKPARVGGLNRSADGLPGAEYTSNSSAFPPSYSAEAHVPRHSSPLRRSAGVTPPSRSAHNRARETAGARGARASPQHNSAAARGASPSRGSMPGSFGFTDPLDFDGRGDIGGAGAANNKAYSRPIPGLSGGGGTGGFRRGRFSNLDGFSDSNDGF